MDVKHINLVITVNPIMNEVNSAQNPLYILCELPSRQIYAWSCLSCLPVYLTHDLLQVVCLLCVCLPLSVPYSSTCAPKLSCRLLLFLRVPWLASHVHYCTIWYTLWIRIITVLHLNRHVSSLRKYVFGTGRMAKWNVTNNVKCISSMCINFVWCVKTPLLFIVLVDMYHIFEDKSHMCHPSCFVDILTPSYPMRNFGIQKYSKGIPIRYLAIPIEFYSKIGTPNGIPKVLQIYFEEFLSFVWV